MCTMTQLAPWPDARTKILSCQKTLPVSCQVVGIEGPVQDNARPQASFRVAWGSTAPKHV